MPFQLRPHPLFSWSHSRDRLLETCSRAYYHRYYLSHNGWSAGPDVSDEARLAYRLKQLTTLHQVLGTALHDAAKASVHRVRDGLPPLSYGSLVEQATAALRHVCRCSRDRAAFLRDPKHHPMLHSMYYRGVFDEAEVALVRGKLERCCYHLSECSLWRELVWLRPTEILLIDSLDTVIIDGIPLYAAPDLVLSVGEAVEIIDWKTGVGADAVRQQLALYAFYLTRKLGLAFDEGQWSGRAIHLYDGNDERLTLTGQDLVQAEMRMRESIATMHALLEDVEANRPKSIEAFPIVSTHRRARCPFCAFFQLCSHDAARSGPC